MGIDFDDAEGIEPELLQQAKEGEAAMKNVQNVSDPIISPESVRNDNDGGGVKVRKQKSFNQVMVSAQNNMNIVSQVANEGGFTGEDKDKFDVFNAYNEWIKTRNHYYNCPDEIVKSTVRYTTLVNGRADQNQIIKAQQQQNETKESCNKSNTNLINTAKEYIEIDRRVKDNKQTQQNTFPVNTTPSNIDKFQVRGSGNSVIEGFDFYNGDSYEPNSGSPPRYNQRLPRYGQSSSSSDTGQTILPWNNYYTNCSAGDELCRNAHKMKDDYITTINALFDKAEEKLKLYKYTIDVQSSDQRISSNSNMLNQILEVNNDSAVNAAVQNQQKEINLHKQQALYNYEQYNSLSFFEDMLSFVYYAVFAILVYTVIRDFYASSATFDKRNIIILIILGIYPKYILTVVLWILNLLTKITHMLGIKNVSFWH